MHIPSKNNIISGIIFLLIAVIFIVFPHPASALYLRITFDEFQGDDCSLYYTTDTDGNFSQDKCITSTIDPETLQVSFRLDGALEGHLTGLRLDFPHAEQLLCIKTVTVSSAGAVRKEYSPCRFFVAENIAMNHNADVTLVPPQDRAYVSTESDDPFLIFSDALTAQIAGYYSHQLLSRLFLCLFMAGCTFFAHRRFFS